MNNDLDKELESSSIESNQNRTEKIHFRCPSCSKLFAANPNNIFDEKPEFTCNSCKTEFSISFSEALAMSEVVGTRIEKPAPQTNQITEDVFQESIHQESFTQEETVNAIKTREDRDAEIKANNFTQAPSLSIPTSEKDPNAPKTSIMDDLKDLLNEVGDSNMEFISASKTSRPPLPKDMWSNVLTDYNDLSLHDEFISFCKEKDDIGYAAKMYKSMTDSNPHDQIAEKYLNKIKLTATMAVKNESQANILRGESSFNVWSAGIIAVGVLFVVLGFTFIQLKNLVGLGIALIFFTFAMQALFNKGE